MRLSKKTMIFPNAIIKMKDLQSDLFSLCRGRKIARKHPEEITYFKSVGHVLEDLAAVSLVYERRGVQAS